MNKRLRTHIMPRLVVTSLLLTVSQMSAASTSLSVLNSYISMGAITPEVPTLAYDDTSLVLTWHQPADYEKVIDYKVYQNGKFIGLSSDNNGVHSPAAPYIQAFFDADADGFHQPTTYLSYKVTNLVANTQYQFSVRAVYADGTESSSSAVLSAKTAPQFKKVVNVLDYGAVGDGVTVNTQSIQKAIDACSKDSKSAYGCKVIIPAARSQNNSQSPVFVSGALFLNSNMTLDIEKGATLKGSTNAEDYPLNQGYQLYSYKTNATDSRRPPSLLNVLSADHRNGSVNEQQGYDARRHTFQNIRVVGGGTLDGGGWAQSDEGTLDETKHQLAYFEAGDRELVFSSLGLLAKSQMLAAWQSQDTHWKTEAELSDLIKLTYGGYDGQVNKDLYSNRRSSLATFRGVTNVYFAELQVLNPAYHTIMFLEGENTVFAYNTVQTFDINNADGVEFGNSQNSVVFANFMDTGDDNINFAAGQGADYEEGHSDVNPVEQVWVFNNYLREGHGAIAIGSHTGAWIQDMLAEENVMFLTNNGLRMKSTTATGGGARRIVFRDNAMKDIGTHNRFQVNGVTIQNRGVLGSPFVATLSYSAGDNVFTDAEIPAQFKDILVENVTVDNVSPATGDPFIKIDGYDGTNASSPYPEVFQENIVFSNVKGKHVRVTSIDHLKDAVFKNMTMTDWNQKQDGFWHIDHAKNVQFINVVPPHANIE